MFNELLFSLRGSSCSYQGEELGLTEAEIEQHQLQDPYGITFWPRFKGRDGCRTPMPWSETATNGGFSQANTWLPVSKAHLPVAVDVQDANKNSVLNNFRDFLAWRKNQPALRWGDIMFLDAPENVVLFIRQYQNQKIVAAFNLSSEPVIVNLTEEGLLTAMMNQDRPMAQLDGGKLVMARYSSAFVSIE